MKYLFLATLIIINVTSCGKVGKILGEEEKFSANKILERYNTANIEKLDFPGSEYSKSTTVKPKVDFLFLWDNSSSTKLISEETRFAMANTINLISDTFDYRIILSPLLGDIDPNPFFESYIVSEDSSYITDTALLERWTRPGYGAEAIFNLLPRGSLENGITRAYDLTKAGFDNNIFRSGAHMIIVVLSNGDDNSWIKGNFPSGLDQSNYVTTYGNNFKALRNSNSSKTFRFLSVVGHSPCAGSKTGTTYKMMSSKLYSLQQQSGFPSPIASASTPDSFDFCKMQSFFRLFDGINAAITPDNIPYQYNYWPITTKKSWRYDRDIKNVKVKVKDSLNYLIGTLPYSTSNGWSFVDGYRTLNIIECPIHPEINCATDSRGKVLVTGYFIKLNGSARITNPQYLEIDTQTPPDFYGYVKLNYKPWIDPNKKISDSIRVKINGVQLPEDGFEYIGGILKNKNVKIKGFNDFSEDTENPLYQTGFFLKLKPSFVFGAGDSVQVDYWPSGT